MRVVASIGVRDYVDGFFVVWLREQEKQLRDCVKLIKKQMMMNDDVEMNEKLRDCEEMKKYWTTLATGWYLWEHGTRKWGTTNDFWLFFRVTNILDIFCSRDFLSSSD